VSGYRRTDVPAWPSVRLPLRAQELAIDSNGLEGAFPKSFGTLGNLTILFASFNAFSGALPAGATRPWPSGLPGCSTITRCTGAQQQAQHGALRADVAACSAVCCAVCCAACNAPFAAHVASVCV
jgi:hypothetical protein